MTEVTFHFNTPDKMGHACRLLRKAVSSGAKVVVTGEASQLDELDVALWTFAPLEFVPHCRHGAVGVSAAVVAASPVVLTESPRQASHQQVLVNLGDPVPDGFEGFERLIEVVTFQEDDRQRARQRWKYYADRGYVVKREDLSSKEAH